MWSPSIPRTFAFPIQDFTARQKLSLFQSEYIIFLVAERLAGCPPSIPADIVNASLWVTIHAYGRPN